jgi:hypothetical protein
MGSVIEDAGVDMPSETDLQNLPEHERLMQGAQAREAAATAQSWAKTLKEKAGMMTDPKERECVMREAYNHELKAHGNSKKARVLKSGTFQGAAGGVGIGAATGVGLGTLVGTVVGGVASIPTTLLGGLVGSGVGAIHGPFIKFGLGDGKKGEVVQVPQEAIDNGAVKVDETGQATVQNPELLRNAVSKPIVENQEGTTESQSSNDTRRKPKKIEIRSKATNTTAPSETPAKKKPRKIEIRSNKT